VWVPGECDVSIRPGWFYHKEEDEKVKTPEQLFQLYLKSVGRGANLLLNVPPDPRGQFHPNDSAALMGFAKLREQFKNNLLPKAKASLLVNGKQKPAPQLTDGNRATGVKITNTGNALAIKPLKPATLNTIVLYEDLQNGQAVSAFTIYLKDAAGQTMRTLDGTTIGRKRILTFPSTTVDEIVITISGQHFAGTISEIEAFRIDESLLEK